MQIARMNWMQVEQRAALDPRCVLPIGSTEQHAYLSLAVDMILAERVATEAAEPSGVPVFPVVPYGMTPTYSAFPGTVTLRMSTYIALIEDILESLHRSGFRRILIVNGHGGNNPVQGFLREWMVRKGDVRVKLHNWWCAPKTWAKTQAIDPAASHASWMENFPWTRLAGVPLPTERKPAVDLQRLSRLNADEARELLGDGNYHGLYERSDAEMQALWAVAVEETRELLETGWD